MKKIFRVEFAVENADGTWEAGTGTYDELTEIAAESEAEAIDIALDWMVDQLMVGQATSRNFDTDGNKLIFMDDDDEVIETYWLMASENEENELMLENGNVAVRAEFFTTWCENYEPGNSTDLEGMTAREAKKEIAQTVDSIVRWYTSEVPWPSEIYVYIFDEDGNSELYYKTDNRDELFNEIDLVREHGAQKVFDEMLDSMFEFECDVDDCHYYESDNKRIEIIATDEDEVTKICVDGVEHDNPTEAETEKALMLGNADIDGYHLTEYCCRDCPWRMTCDRLDDAITDRINTIR